MGRVLTNDTALVYAHESTELPGGVAGLLPGEPGAPAGPVQWYQVERTEIDDFGFDITKAEFNPISRNRQRRKGKQVSVKSDFGFSSPLTMMHIESFAEGFFFARYQGAHRYDPSAVTASAYTVATGPVLVARSLVYSRGFTNAANNGLKVVGAAATATSIPTTGLVVEGTPPDDATVEVAGFRTAAGDLAVTIVSGDPVITSTAQIFNSPGLDLQPGAGIYFGGSAALNRFTNAENIGYARIKSVAADGSSITIDKVRQTWVAEAAGTQEVDFYIGRFVTNVPRDNALFLERSYQVEMAMPNLAAAGATAYQYSRGNYSNSLTLNMPLNELVTFQAGMIGLNTDAPTTSRKTGAASALPPLRGTDAFSSSVDCTRLRIQDLDGIGIGTDFTSFSLTIENNVSRQFVLCNGLEAKYINFGNFNVNFESQLVFTDPAIITALKTDQDVKMDSVLRNSEGAIYIDFPVLTLAGGGLDLPIDESVLINITGQTHQDPTLDTSLGMTIFAFVPDNE